MRIDVKKILFVGMEEDRTPFFKKAQELGVIQFIDEKQEEQSAIPRGLQDINAALKVLRGLKPSPQEEGDDTLIVPAILALKKREESLLEEVRHTRLEIARVHVFGNFSLQDIQAIEKDGKCVIQYFCAKEGKGSNDLIYIGTDQGMDYFISISKERVFFDNMIEMQIDEPLGLLQKRLKEKTEEIHQTEKELNKYSKYSDYLHQVLINHLNHHQLQRAVQYPDSVMEGNLFSVVGWIPTDKVPMLKMLNVYFEEIAVHENDKIPTHLENEGLASAGEELVHLYDTPSSTDIDPSLWVLSFFALFYAMIIGDAGYGIVFLLTSFYFFSKTKMTPLKKMIYVLSGACIVWGVLINSFFGLNIAPESPLRKVSLLQWVVNKKANYHLSLKDQVYREWLVKYPEVGEVNSYTDFLRIKNEGSHSYDILNVFSDNILLELALMVGVLHICLSLARYMGRNWAGIGWILAIIGGYMYVPSYLQLSSMIHFVFGLDQVFAATVGGYLFIFGTSLAVILSLIQNRWMGLLEITLLIQIFSDVLSYLRLYALALAGAIISVTVNEIASSLHIVFAIILVIVGHIINMGLSIMGGVIHGLRLNFLEWYHYSFQGGGRRFSPLYIQRKEH